MKRVFIVVSLGLTLSAGAIAKPSYAVAQGYWKQLRQFQAEISLWPKKSPTERKASAGRAVQLFEQVRKSWPESQFCKGAAMQAVDLNMTMNQMTSALQTGSALDGKLPFDAIYSAVSFGQQLEGCSEEVEDLG